MEIAEEAQTLVGRFPNRRRQRRRAKAAEDFTVQPTVEGRKR